jgi:hypothetical protein
MTRKAATSLSFLMFAEALLPDRGLFWAFPPSSGFPTVGGIPIELRAFEDIYSHTTLEAFGHS